MWYTSFVLCKAERVTTSISCRFSNDWKDGLACSHHFHLFITPWPGRVNRNSKWLYIHMDLSKILYGLFIPAHDDLFCEADPRHLNRFWYAATQTPSLMCLAIRIYRYSTMPADFSRLGRSLSPFKQQSPNPPHNCFFILIRQKISSLR